MTLSVVLGANLWIVAVAAPLLVGPGWTWKVPGALVAAVVGLALAGPAVLGWGVRRRSPALLFAAFPVVCALPLAVLAGGNDRLMAIPPWLLAAGCLVGYLFVTAQALERLRTAGDPEPAKAVALPGELVAPRWRRRLRIYRGLTALTVIFPLTLLWYVDLRGATGVEVARSFGPAADGAHTLFTVGAGVLWMLLFRFYFVQPMYEHLQHDRDLLGRMEAARKQARRGRPRPRFYLYVAGALAAMLAVVLRGAH